MRGKIVLVRYSVPYSYRGFKALTAEQRGAAGLLIYSDPVDDGAAKGKVYPDGPWGPESHIQRGGIAYDFMVPGDPLTPGWASTPGAPRVAARDAVSLPAIVSAPLSYNDARVILEALGGPEVPRAWRGAGAFTYRAGPGQAVVRLRVRLDDRVRPVWTVTGTHSRQRAARRRGDCRESPRCLGLRRRRSVERIGGARRARRRARVRWPATDGGRGGRFSSPAGTPRSSR